MDGTDFQYGPVNSGMRLELFWSCRANFSLVANQEGDLEDSLQVVEATDTTPGLIRGSYFVQYVHD